MSTVLTILKNNKRFSKESFFKIICDLKIKLILQNFFITKFETFIETSDPRGCVPLIRVVQYLDKFATASMVLILRVNANGLSDCIRNRF